MEEGERSVTPPPPPVEATPMETTLSSLSTDFVLVEVPINDQATTKDAATPVIIPLVTDNIVDEPTKLPSVSSTTIKHPPEAKGSDPIDSSFATPIKAKFKVIGGRVLYRCG